MIDSAKIPGAGERAFPEALAIANDLRGNMDSTKFRNYILGDDFLQLTCRSVPRSTCRRF